MGTTAPNLSSALVSTITPPRPPPSPVPPFLSEQKGEEGNKGKEEGEKEEKEKEKQEKEEKEEKEEKKEEKGVEGVTEEDRAILDALRSAFLRTNQEMYTYFKNNKLSPKVKGELGERKETNLFSFTFIFLLHLLERNDGCGCFRVQFKSVCCKYRRFFSFSFFFLNFFSDP